ncbi:MAG: site-specific DNA-methyltransferase [Clostridiales Family XIII bacterium]|jgi:DNA modification methylase|nr:site-specific DNA-methyltransferase [Clostridiales Family XIII bacterium]
MDILERLPVIIKNARELWERHTIPADISYEAVMDRYEGIKQAAWTTDDMKTPLSPPRQTQESTLSDEDDSPIKPAHDDISHRLAERGRIITGDSLNAAKTLLAAVTAGVQEAPELIYMDPPFFTNVKYVQTLNIKGADDEKIPIPFHAFSDRWDEECLKKAFVAQEGDGGGPDAAGESTPSKTNDFARYLMMLALRITAAYDLLSDSGSLWIHLDHHAAHYIKVLADQIFGGPEHLLNEVIWQYKSGGATKKHFARKHDTLLFYAKHPAKHRFSPMLEKSYNRGRKPYRFKGVKEYRDEGGWYTLVNMRDVWQIDMVGRTAGERTGFATQKPEALLERIVSSSTAPGNLCMDLFGGSGTLAAVCEKCGRRWTTIDISRLASLNAERRMAGLGAAFEIMNAEYTVADDPPEARARRWSLSAAYEPTADPSKSLVTVKPISYTVPSGVSESDSKQAEIRKAAEKYPAQFAAVIAADVKYDGALFRPQHASYGAGELKMLVGNDLLSGQAGGDDGDGSGRDRSGRDGNDNGVNDVGASPRIMVRVVDLFGNAEIMPLPITRVKNRITDSVVAEPRMTDNMTDYR